MGKIMSDLKTKSVGKRKEPQFSQEAAQQIQKTVAQLRPVKWICRRGLYKFKTFEEADQWMEQEIAQNSLVSRH